MTNDLVATTRSLLTMPQSPFVGPSAIGADTSTLEHRLLTGVGTGLVKERWKYSRLNRYLEAGVANDPKLNSAVRINGADGVAGVRVTAFAELQQQDRESADELSGYFNNSEHWARYPLADAVSAFESGAVIVQIDNVLTTPIDLTLDPGWGFTIIRLAAAAQATVNVRYSTNTEFGCHWVLFQLENGAILKHSTLLAGAEVSHQRWLLNHIQLKSDAQYFGHQYAVTAGQQRVETQVDLQEPGAAANLLGASVVLNKEQLDQQNTIEHQAPHCESNQQFHTITGTKGRNTFNGRIHIHADAQQTNAHLQNRNLSLDHSAVINTKPELEIYADDVRCSHGATVGQIDTDALFYLKSRGLNEAQARQLLLRAFVEQTVAGPLVDEAGELLQLGLQ